MSTVIRDPMKRLLNGLYDYLDEDDPRITPPALVKKMKNPKPMSMEDRQKNIAAFMKQIADLEKKQEEECSGRAAAGSTDVIFVSK